jgi:hypothetical protein
MINSYCDSLEDTFAQLVYFGVLKEEDAQCFSVQSSIEGGSFMLAAGAVLLALINTFVTKAVLQYFRDKDEEEKRIRDDKSEISEDITNSDVDGENDADGGFAARIHPVPVLFTDTFRWMLRPENRLASRSRALFADPSADHWGLPEATAVAYDDQADGGTATNEGEFAFEADEAELKSRAAPSSVSSVSKTSSSRFSGRGRKLTYYDEDEKASTRASIQAESLPDRSSFKSESGPARGNLKDDRSFASSGSQENPSVSAASASRLVAASVARSTASSVDTPQETFEEEMTLTDEKTVEEILAEEEYSEAAANDADSEYAEETVADFEEYTVNSIDNILEEEYEDYSEYDSRSGSHQVV